MIKILFIRGCKCQYDWPIAGALPSTPCPAKTSTEPVDIRVRPRPERRRRRAGTFQELERCMSLEHPIAERMVRDRGFEPLTPSVSRKCSTTELTAHSNCGRIKLANSPGLASAEFPVAGQAWVFPPTVG